MNTMALASKLKNDYIELLDETVNSGSEPKLVLVKRTDGWSQIPNNEWGARRNTIESAYKVELSRKLESLGYCFYDASEIQQFHWRNRMYRSETADKETEAKTMPLLTSYIEVAMAEAQYEPFEGDTFYAFIPSCPGVWSNECTIDDCKRDLREALEFWLILKLRDNDYIPVINGLDLNSIEELEV